MNIFKKWIFITLLFGFGCEKQGIMNGGSYKNGNQDVINTFYIYDYISIDDIKNHGLTLPYFDETILTNYYFSYNSTFPSHSLSISKDISDANKLINEYAFNIKYASIRTKSGKMKFVDCSKSPNDSLCSSK